MTHTSIEQERGIDIERADFEAAFPPPKYVYFSSAGRYFPSTSQDRNVAEDYQRNWEVWQARAAIPQSPGEAADRTKVVSVKTWQDRMPKPRVAFQCDMNCSGVGMGAVRDKGCGDCMQITVYGDALAARDAEIADWRAFASARVKPVAVEGAALKECECTPAQRRHCDYCAGFGKPAIVATAGPPALPAAGPDCTICDGFGKAFGKLCDCRKEG